MALRRGYAGAAHPPDVKATLGAVGSQLRGRGWSVREVGELFVDAGYVVGHQTVRDWTDAVDAGRPITSPAKRTGARKELSYEQRQVAAGWVLSADKKVDLRRFCSFVFDSFGVDISHPTASRYLAEFDLSRQMTGSRPRPPGVSLEMSAKEGYNYILDLHNSGFFLHDPNLIWAVDFTSTAIKKEHHTYSAKGGKQRKYTQHEHIYTDNIFTATALDGSIIPPHAFSHNPALKPGSARLGFLCQQYDISPDQIAYCPDARNWVGETVDMTYTAVKNYSWNDCYVVHDDGNSWKPKGDDIFTEYKAARVSTMPSIPHGVISPNDCNYHSVAKAAERASRPDDATDADITFRTLHYLGNVSADAIRSFWRHNFMLDVAKPTLAAYVDRLKGSENLKEERQQLHRECIDAYDAFVAQDAEDGSE